MSRAEKLFWHCLHCGAHDPVLPTGDGEEYELGDKEKCTECGEVFAYVVTLHMGAIYEQGRALGMSLDAAWLRALNRGEKS